MLFCLSSPSHRTSGYRNRNHGPSGQPSGRASYSATEIRGDLSHSLAFSSLKYYIAHQKSFGSSVATAPDQYLKIHGAFLLRRGSSCDCTSRRSPCAFFFPLLTPPVTQRGLYGGKSLRVKSSLWWPKGVFFFNVLVISRCMQQNASSKLSVYFFHFRDETTTLP